MRFVNGDSAEGRGSAPVDATDAATQPNHPHPDPVDRHWRSYGAVRSTSHTPNAPDTAIPPGRVSAAADRPGRLPFKKGSSLMIEQDPTFLVNMIEVSRRGLRRCRVIDPATGASNWHGLDTADTPLSAHSGSHRVGDRALIRVPRRPAIQVDVPDHHIDFPADLSTVLVMVENVWGEWHPGTVADLGNLGTLSGAK